MFGRFIGSSFVQPHWNEIQETLGCCGWKGEMKLNETCKEPDCIVYFPINETNTLVFLETLFTPMAILFLCLSCCTAVRISQFHLYYWWLLCLITKTPQIHVILLRMALESYGCLWNLKSSFKHTLIQWVFHIRLLEQVLQGAGYLGKVDGRSPVLAQNIQAHMTCCVNVRMENLLKLMFGYETLLLSLKYISEAYMDNNRFEKVRKQTWKSWRWEQSPYSLQA